MVVPVVDLLPAAGLIEELSDLVTFVRVLTAVSLVLELPVEAMLFLDTPCPERNLSDPVW